jgi:hypothetical protein
METIMKVKEGKYRINGTKYYNGEYEGYKINTTEQEIRIMIKGEYESDESENESERGIEVIYKKDMKRKLRYTEFKKICKNSKLKWIGYGEDSDIKNKERGVNYTYIEIKIELEEGMGEVEYGIVVYGEGEVYTKWNEWEVIQEI